MKKISIIYIVFLLLLPQYIWSQTTMLFTAGNYSNIDNHSVVNIRTFFKDKYEFVWIASQDGLLRTDGKNSVLYSSDTDDRRYKLLSNDVDAVVADNNDSFIWVLSSYGGLVKIDVSTGNVVHRIVFVSPQLPNSNFYFRGIEKSAHYLFIISEEGYVFKINTLNNTWEFKKIVSTGNKLRLEYFYKVNNFFVLFNDGNSVLLYDFNTDRITDYKKADFSVYTKSGTVLNDTLFVGTKTGIHKVLIKGNQLELIEPDNELLKKGEVFSVGVFRDKLIFSVNDFVYLYNTKDKTYTKLSPSLGFEKRKWYKNITAYLFFKNEVWVGNELGLSIIKINSAFTPFYQDINSNIQLSHCYHINALNDSTLIISCADGVYQINEKNSAVSHIVQEGYYLTSFVFNRLLVVSGLQGTFFLENKKIKKISSHLPELQPLDDDVLIEPVFYKDSLIIMASQNSKGMYFYDIKKSKLRIINLQSNPVRLQNLNINKLFLDRYNRLWILSDNLISIYNFSNNSLTDYTLLNPGTKEPVAIIKDVCYVNGNYFIAAYGMGIFQVNENMEVMRHFGVSNGIKNTNLYKVLPLNDSLLLTSSNYGLYSINLFTNKVKQYEEQHGLQSNFFEQYSGLIFNDHLYFGGINGITRITPQLVVKNYVPPSLLINQISITDAKITTDSTNAELKKITIPNNALQSKIIFSAVNWTNPGSVIYHYRILEQSKEWINLNTQNFITLIGLSPGTYHLQVKAANEDGVWSEPKELILEFLPKWYQTLWFKLLVALTTAGIIYGFYRYRIRQIQKQHEIRKNIATDLHDDLGSTLNSVKVFTNLAISGVKQEESLQQVKDNLTEATMSLRDMIWVLDDSLDTVNELVTRLKQFALPITGASNMEFVVNAGSDVNSRTLSKEEKRNLFLICKEAINNSIKYSGASKITVEIIPSGKKVQLTIADNGKGFDEATVKKGYGLKNMQYRAGQIGYKIQIITSAINNGTTIFIK